MEEEKKKNLLCICGHNMNEHKDEVGYIPPLYSCTKCSNCEDFIEETPEVKLVVKRLNYLNMIRNDLFSHRVYCFLCYEELGKYASINFDNDVSSDVLKGQAICSDCYLVLRKILRKQFE